MWEKTINHFISPSNERTLGETRIYKKKNKSGFWSHDIKMADQIEGCEVLAKSLKDQVLWLFIPDDMLPVLLQMIRKRLSYIFADHLSFLHRNLCLSTRKRGC